MPTFYSLSPLFDNSVTNEKLADSAVTNVKVSASAAVAFSKLAALPSTDIILGSGTNVPTATAVSGDITIGNTGITAIGAQKVVNSMLADNAVGLDEMAHGTAGNLITYDATGAPAAVPTGNVAQVLTSNGAGAAPTFQAAAAGGGALLFKAGGEITTTAAITTYDVATNYVDISFSAAELAAVDMVQVLLFGKNGGNQSLRASLYIRDTTSNPTSADYDMAGNGAVAVLQVLLNQDANTNTSMQISGLRNDASAVVSPIGETLATGDANVFTTAWTLRINTRHNAPNTGNSQWHYKVYIVKGS